MNRPIDDPTIDTRPGWGHAQDLVPIVAGLANRDAASVEVIRWTRQAVVDAGVARGDVEGEARAVLAAAERDIRYTDDPVQHAPSGEWETHELAQAPIVTLELRAGDCVAFAGLIGSAMQSLGRVVRYTVTALRQGIPRHITVEVQGPGGWFTLDPVPQPHRVGYGQHVAGAQVHAWSSTGEQIPMGAYQVAGPGGEHVSSRIAIAGGLGDVTSELVDLRSQVIQSGLDTAIDDKIALVAPYLDKISVVNQAVEAGDAWGLEEADDMVNTITTFTAMAGPYGAVLSAVIRALWALGRWLIEAYPAHEIRCSPSMPLAVAHHLGFEEPYAAGKCYRDSGYLYLVSYTYRVDTWSDWEYFNTGEAPEKYRFDRGTSDPFESSVRWDTVASICAPVRSYATPAPPGVGYRSWQEWIANHPENAIVQSTNEAELRIALDNRQRLVDGGIKWLHISVGDTCEIWGYAFPVSALPDATLLELIRRIMVFAMPEGEGIDPEVAAEAVALDPLPPGPDLPEGGVMEWRDGLSAGLMHYVRNSPYKDYHFAALLAEYSKRRQPGGSLEGLAVSGETATLVSGIAPRPRALEAMPFALREPSAAETDVLEPGPGAIDEPVMVLPPPAQLPQSIPAGMSTQEAQVLAAIRYQDAVRDAQRADAAARAYYGMSGPCGCSCDRCPESMSCPTLAASLGLALPRIVDAETEADIIAGMQGKSSLLADRSLNTWARQANYGLSHLLDPLSRRVVAVRLMNWKRAHGWEPLDSFVDDGIRAALAADGSFDVGAVPTLPELEAKVGEVRAPEPTAEEPVEVLPPGTLPPEDSTTTATGLPGAIAPVSPIEPLPMSIPAPGPGGTEEPPPATSEPSTSRAFPEGAPGGATMVSPPGTAEVTLKTKTDTGTLVLGALALYYASRKRRTTNPSRRRRRRR